MGFFCSCFSFSISDESAELTLIFLVESILFSLELRLAKANFFFPPSSLGGYGLTACGRGGG